MKKPVILRRRYIPYEQAFKADLQWGLPAAGMRGPDLEWERKWVIRMMINNI